MVNSPRFSVLGAASPREQERTEKEQRETETRRAEINKISFFNLSSV